MAGPVTPITDPLQVELSPETQRLLEQFVAESDFAHRGGIVTDLDGTALHEDHGRILIPRPVEVGFQQLHELGRPFVLNSLRFPLSILRTFGREWYNISNAPIPTVSMNGSMLGYVAQDHTGAMAFEQIAAYPLTAQEIDRTLDGVDELLKHNIKEVLLFYYPRDWRTGEIIWTPDPEQIIPVKEKYRSASAVTAVDLTKLRDQLHAEDICMIFLLLNVAEENLMAYQHTKRSNFVTHAGVDKLFGAQRMAEQMHFDLAASIGAGDTELDRFLSGVGMAVIVGGLQLSLQGVRHTIRLKDSFELGELLYQAALLVARSK
jgi:hydroxymethylpyrimidine pyrophosphatase-like HAD family hydrolase